MNKMNLPFIRSQRIFGDQRAMPNRLPAMGVARDAAAGLQNNRACDRLAEIVRLVAPYR